MEENLCLIFLLLKGDSPDYQLNTNEFNLNSKVLNQYANHVMVFVSKYQKIGAILSISSIEEVSITDFITISTS